MTDYKLDSAETFPSIEEWLRQAKQEAAAEKAGMYLIHNGVVRDTPREYAREGTGRDRGVTGMIFSFNEAKVGEAAAEASKLEGITYIRIWLNSGKLNKGDDIMYILIGGDIRPNVISGLEFLVNKIKSECVTEMEEMEAL